jgi:hypothetical protein
MRSGNLVEASLSDFPKATVLAIKAIIATSIAAIVVTKLLLIFSFEHSSFSFDSESLHLLLRQVQLCPKIRPYLTTIKHG